jgi:hypothetical protein
MALIAVMTGVNPRNGYHHRRSNKHYAIVEYHVKYNTTTDQTHLKQTTVVVGGRINLKRGYHCSNKYYLKHIVWVLLDLGHNRHLVLLPRQTHAVSQLK